MKFNHKILLLVILLIGTFFRFYLLNDVPTGIHADEASQGYNAFSLIKTGKDMYRKSFPILFRANGSYQPPVYTYLTIVPTLIFGNSVFTTRFISALSGTFLIFLTFYLVKRFGVGNKKERLAQALFSSLTIAISPWTIHFSRLAVEGNLVVCFFVSGLILLYLSLKKPKLFIPACIVFGLSTHVYYTERVTSLIFIAGYLLIFRKYFIGQFKKVFLGLFILFLILLPHLYLVKTGALTRRFSQVSYFSDSNLMQGSKLGKAEIAMGEFFDHYLYYFSPKNLFIDSGQNLGRTSYDLSVFYPWYLIPLLFGILFFAKNYKNDLVKMLTLGLFITPIPAGLTGDLFYPLRVLCFLWIISILISFGIYYIWKGVNKYKFTPFVIFAVVVYSLFLFYISYFAISRYENINDNGYSYIKLMDKLDEYWDKNIIIDYNQRAWGAGIRMAYLMKVDPKIIQDELISQLVTPYYSGEVNAFEIYTIKNLTVRAIDWKNDLCIKDVLFIGDEYMVDKSRIEEMGLTQVFSVNDIRNNPTLFGYISRNKNCIN